MKNSIHQIYYSPQTHAKLDPGFIPLDNTGQRPDWYEYWPIRRFLLENTLEPNARYGFFSPKFAEKTGLGSAQVAQFLADTPDDVDVVTFSPFFSNIAFFKNVFEQADFWHPGIASTLEGVMSLIAPHLDAKAVMNGLVMSTAGTVYCNYFVARPRFWQRWLTLCERIFAAAEAGDTELAQQLNDNRHYVLPTPAKVFVIERIASIILSTEPAEWKIRNYDSTVLLADNDLLDGLYREEMVTLDALKIAAIRTGVRAYYEQFVKARQQLMDRYTASRAEAVAAPATQQQVLDASEATSAAPIKPICKLTQTPGVKPIRFVCGTRFSREQFWNEAALGRSLKLYRDQPDVQLQLFENNTCGLSSIYNAAIEDAKQNRAILIFIHDDVWLTDVFWADRIRSALSTFDVASPVGNLRRVPRQPAWCCLLETMSMDESCNLSGAIAYGKGLPDDEVSVFGPTALDCKLLGDFMLMTDSETLVSFNLRFDEQFKFHFYGMDFCRQVELKGLRMGTLALSAACENPGQYDSPDWREGYEMYLRKYGT